LATEARARAAPRAGCDALLRAAVEAFLVRLVTLAVDFFER
jgi:hypothetical protein